MPVNTDPVTLPPVCMAPKSRAGMINENEEADNMTPALKPISTLFARFEMYLKPNAGSAPRLVAKAVTPQPNKTNSQFMVL